LDIEPMMLALPRWFLLGKWRKTNEPLSMRLMWSKEPVPFARTCS